MRLTINSILPKELVKATDKDLLWLHGKLHKAATLDRDHLLESHLLVVQEIVRRGLEHTDKADGFDSETAAFASENLSLSADELADFGLVEQAIDEDDVVVKFLSVEKADDEERTVLGIALEPGEIDSQNDTIKPPVIKVAAHNWLAKWQDRGVQHKQIVNSKIEIYESYIAPVNLTLGGQKVKKGSWVLMYHILDDKLWADIKAGKFTGFSIGGFARRAKV